MISVCLASYNGEKYIKEQIESILQQLSVNDELIVSDDGSTDHTLSIIAEIGDPRIKIYFHKSEVNDLGCYSRSHYLVTRNFECALSVALWRADGLGNGNHDVADCGLLRFGHLLLYERLPKRTRTECAAFFCAYSLLQEKNQWLYRT